MEKLNQYRKLIKKVLTERLSNTAASANGFQEQFIIDKLEQNFLLITFGWIKKEYQYFTIFHLELKGNGQIWIHENRSDVQIEDELVNCGIQKMDLFGSMISPKSQNLFPETELVTMN